MPLRPGALIDFRSPDGLCEPLHLAFGPPRERLSAHHLAEVIPVIRRAEALALAGAWCVGYLAYEAAAAFDTALTTHTPAPGNGLLAQFLVFDAPLQRADSEAAWNAGQHQPAVARWHSEPGRAAFDADVAHLHRAIANGDVYQVNLTAALCGTLEGDPLGLFHQLRHAQPNAYAAFIDGGEGHDTVLSVSPELFFDWRDGRLLASPMKGTAPRGRNPAEDEAQRRRLCDSPKERAENVMIVDLLRNDLSRVARPFSVQVPRLFHAEAWPTVWQLSSDVTARTRAGVGLAEVFGALFPCGSITGAPKARAMQLIHTLERAPRGIYCGAVGVLQPGGTASFNVPIRTLTLRGSRLRCGIGSGITADADAAGEWDEWHHKRAFVERASEPFELLETLRMNDGQMPSLQLHLARMATSAVHFGFAWDRARVENALGQIASQHPEGPWRVRICSAADGSVRAQAFALEPPQDSVLVALAGHPVVRSDGEFFRHKTTRRAHYDAFAPRQAHVFDTLLWNERCELTEFTRGNVALLLDGQWLTPPLGSGLLPGVARACLLQEGRLRESTLRVQDLDHTRELAFFNSLRGWLPARRVSPPADESIA